jgi:hypothetical protein
MVSKGLVGFVLALSVATAVCGQTAPASAGKTSAPAAAKTSAPAAGKAVDISGIWGPAFVQSLSEDTPLLPAAQKQYSSTKPEDDPLGKCMPPGIPRLMNLLFPFEVLQTPKVVYFLMEYGQHTRRIFIDGKHPADLDPTWHGHSIGHWEGRTLVVDTIGFNEDTWLDMRGHPHSDALHVIERYTLPDDGQSLKQEVTIDDPKMYSKPWQTVSTTHKRAPTSEIHEFICVPG